MRLGVDMHGHWSFIGHSQQELRLIHTARRLYQRSSSNPTKQRQDLARRFAAAVKIIKEKNGESIPDDLAKLQSKLEEYQDLLDKWGLKDYQVLW